jgi:hypothetical protein
MAGLDGSFRTMRADGTITGTGKANTAGSSTTTNGTGIVSGIITNTGNMTVITIETMTGTTIAGRSNFSK